MQNSLFRAVIKRQIPTCCKVLYTKLVRVISSCFETKMLSKNTGFSRLTCRLNLIENKKLTQHVSEDFPSFSRRRSG